MILTVLLLGFAIDPVLIPVSRPPHRPAVADMNADGHPDLVVGCDRAIVIALNDGKGHFRETSHIDLTGNPTELAFGDFNNDGHLDVAFADHDTLAVVVLAGDGKGGLRRLGMTRVRKTGKPHIHGLLAGDWNGDRKSDLAHFNIGEGELTILMGDGRGEMSSTKSLAVNHPNNPTRADVNRDGIADLVVPNTEKGEVSVFLGDGKGSFQPAPGSPHRVLQRPYYSAVGDINSDGFPDIAVTHDDIGQMVVFMGEGSGRFHPMPGSPVSLGAIVWTIEITDLNGDKRADIVAASASEFVILLQRPDGKLASPRKIAKPATDNWRAAAADLNGDGSAELIDVDAKSLMVRIFPGPVTR